MHTTLNRHVSSVRVTILHQQKVFLLAESALAVHLVMMESDVSYVLQDCLQIWKAIANRHFALNVQQASTKPILGQRSVICVQQGGFKEI